MSESNRVDSIRPMIYSAVFAGLIAAGAFIQLPLPFSPVPITLQTLFVLIAGAMLPVGWAAASVGLYLGAGAIGLPVFAGGARGLSVFIGPSGGFLIGFLLSATITSLICSRLRRKDRFKTLPLLLTLIIGTLVIYAIGLPWIAINLGWDLRIAVANAVVPYLAGDVLKIIVAFAAAKGMEQRFSNHA